MVQDMRLPYLLQEREGVIFQQPHPTEDFQTVQVPYTEVGLLKVSRIKDYQPFVSKMELKTYSHDKTARVVMINRKTFNTVLPSRNRHLVLMPKSYFNVPFISSNEFIRTKILTALKLQ